MTLRMPSRVSHQQFPPQNPIKLRYVEGPGPPRQSVSKKVRKVFDSDDEEYKETQASVAVELEPNSLSLLYRRSPRPKFVIKNETTASSSPSIGINSP